MPIIRPMVGAAKYFTAGHLTKQLKSKNISYSRYANENTIGISFQTDRGETFKYLFDKETALIRSKIKTSKDCNYETNWDDGTVSFSMVQGHKITKIQKSVENRIQGFWDKFFHGKKASYVLTQIDKNVAEGERVSGWTKKIHQFPQATIVDMIPHRSFKIKYSGLQTRMRNITDETVERAINFQLNRKA